MCFWTEVWTFEHKHGRHKLKARWNYSSAFSSHLCQLNISVTALCCNFNSSFWRISPLHHLKMPIFSVRVQSFISSSCLLSVFKYWTVKPKVGQYPPFQQYFDFLQSADAICIGFRKIPLKFIKPCFQLFSKFWRKETYCLFCSIRWPLWM